MSNERLFQMAGGLPLIMILSVAACEGPDSAVEVEEGQAQPLVDCEPGPDSVALFRETHYRGGCSYYGINGGSGHGFNPYLGNDGWPDPIGNDAVKSVKVGSNVSVMLFAEANYMPPPKRSNPLARRQIADTFPMSHDVPDLVHYNNYASAAYVASKDRDCFTQGFEPSRGEVVLYDHANYGGRCMVFRANEYWESDTPGLFANWLESPLRGGMVSSLKVGPGTRVMLFDNYNFKGGRETFFSNARVPGLGSNSIGNDKALSMVVAYE